MNDPTWHFIKGSKRSIYKRYGEGAGVHLDFANKSAAALGLAVLNKDAADDGKLVLREQLRWAWAKLGCRCIFNILHEKIHDDAHCPVHGVYESGERGQWTDPFGNKGPYDADVGGFGK